MHCVTHQLFPSCLIHLVLFFLPPTRPMICRRRIPYFFCCALHSRSDRTKSCGGQKKGSTNAISRPHNGTVVVLPAHASVNYMLDYFYCRIISKLICGNAFNLARASFLKRAAAASNLIGNVRWIFISDPLSRLESGPDIGASVRDWG